MVFTDCTTVILLVEILRHSNRNFCATLITKFCYENKAVTASLPFGKPTRLSTHCTPLITPCERAAPVPAIPLRFSISHPRIPPLSLAQETHPGEHI